MVALATTLPPVGQGSNNIINGTLSALSTDPRHLHYHAHQPWSLAKEFQQRSIKIELHVKRKKGHFKICLVPIIIDELSDD